MRDWIDHIHKGNSLELLREMPSDYVDTVLTSPPYWGLRAYGTDTEVDWPDGWHGQLGLEPTIGEYVNHLCLILTEIKRVLKSSGSFWLNLGDTYNGGGFWDPERWPAKEIAAKPAHYDRSGTIPRKSLSGIPWRVLLRLIDDGWACRNVVVWHKPNHMPSSVKDRLSNGWEPVFHLVKDSKYYYDLDAIREEPVTFEGRPGGAVRTRELGYSSKFNIRVRDAKEGRLKEKWGSLYSAGAEETESYDEKAYSGKFNGMDPNQAELFNSPRARTQRQRQSPYKGKGWNASWPGGGARIVRESDPRWLPPEGKNPGDVIKIGNHHGSSLTEGRAVHYEGQDIEADPRGKNPGDYWEITTKSFPESHFAVFPEALCIRPILATCPKEGIVLDPFGGAGTVGLMAKRLRRHYVLLEVKQEYCEMAERRLATHPPVLEKFEEAQ